MQIVCGFFWGGRKTPRENRGAALADLDEKGYERHCANRCLVCTYPGIRWQRYASFSKEILRYALPFMNSRTIHSAR